MPAPVKRQMFRVVLKFPKNHKHEPWEEITYVKAASQKEGERIALHNHPEATEASLSVVT